MSTQVLELAGLEADWVHFGRSLAPQLHGERGWPRTTVFSEGGYSTHEPRDFEGSAATGGMPEPTDIYYPKLLQQQKHPLSVCRAVSARTLTHKLVLRTDPSVPQVSTRQHPFPTPLAATPSNTPCSCCAPTRACRRASSPPSSTTYR